MNILNTTVINEVFMFVSLQMVQSIQVLRFHLLELEKVRFVSVTFDLFTDLNLTNMSC